MPILETKKLEKLLKTIPVHRPTLAKNEQENDCKDNHLLNDIVFKDDTTEPVDDEYLQFLSFSLNEKFSLNSNSKRTLLLQLQYSSAKSFIKKGKRSRSMIPLKETSLAEELNLDKKKIKMDKYKTTDYVKIRLYYGVRVGLGDDSYNKRIDMYELSKQDDKQIALKLKQDLENLTIELRRKETLKENEDEPLLMTLMSKPNLSRRMQEIKDKIRIMNKRERQFMEEIKLPLVEEKEHHAQPSTIETKFFNNVRI